MITAAHPSCELSIVIPVLNEEDNVGPLYEEIKTALNALSYEVIFVDDGSRDNTLSRIKELHAADSRVKAVSFRTNNGKAAAYAAAFKVASGDIVATMDGDLQDDPSDLHLLLNKLREDHLDMVVGWKSTGKSSPTTFILSKALNAFIRNICKVELHDMNCPMRVMRSVVAKNLTVYSGNFRYIPLIATNAGFRVAEGPISNRARRYGKSKYSARKYLRSLFDFIALFFLLKFYTRPFHAFGLAGIVCAVIGFVVEAVIALFFFFSDYSPQDDLPTLLFGILLIFVGLQLGSLGLLGEYLLMSEMRASKAPLALVAEEVGLQPQEDRR